MIYLCYEQLKQRDMKTTRIYISADKTTATIVAVFRYGASARSEETVYRIKGKRWVTPLDELKKAHPKAEILQE